MIMGSTKNRPPFRIKIFNEQPVAVSIIKKVSAKRAKVPFGNQLSETPI